MAGTQSDMRRKAETALKVQQDALRALNSNPNASKTDIKAAEGRVGSAKASLTSAAAIEYAAIHK